MILSLKLVVDDDSSSIEVKIPHSDKEIQVQGLGPDFSENLLKWVDDLIKFCEENVVDKKDMH